MTDKLRAAAEAALDVLFRAGEELRWQSIGQVERELRAALDEQDAEPVAWGMRHSDGRIYDCIAPGEHDREPGQYTVPLYTAPPRREWVPLTGEDIEAAWKACDPKRLLPSFAAAIEAALKEKNNG